MIKNKVIRTVCYFTDNPNTEDVEKTKAIVARLEAIGYKIQTKRMCAPFSKGNMLQSVPEDTLKSMGELTFEEAREELPQFFASNDLSFNVDLTDTEIATKHVDLLFEIIQTDPSKTFNFTFTFNNASSSPYFPSAKYERNGFAIGLQPTDLAAGCTTLEEWLAEMKKCWDEIATLFENDPDFLGIDSSIAPIGGGDGSFVHFIKRIGYGFEQSATTNIYTTITNFIKTNNPKPVGLCGMMLPCLEDDELAAEYDKGNFSIERNIFLSLHSGLGIDTYPIGIDENHDRVVEILQLVQSLSNKYSKPLSARFVSDGKSRIGQRSDFQNQYLADCTILAL